MSEPSYKIDQSLLNAINAMNSASFTAGQLKEAFCKELDLCNPHIIKVVQKWIYRQLAKLVKNGLLQRNKAKNPRMTSYRKLLDFSDLNFEFCRGPFQECVSEVLPNSAVIESVELPLGTLRSAINDLSNRAKQCHVDLLSAVGESEEYKALFKEYPSLRDALHSRYQQALENSSKLLGQLRAIEAALEHYKAMSA